MLVEGLLVCQNSFENICDQNIAKVAAAEAKVVAAESKATAAEAKAKASTEELAKIEGGYGSSSMTSGSNAEDNKDEYFVTHTIILEGTTFFSL